MYQLNDITMTPITAAGDPPWTPYSGVALKEPHNDMKAALIEEEKSLDAEAGL
jgi:hypothetical protein